MQRTMLWTLSLIFVISITMLADDQRAAAQLLDPMPIDDEASDDSELPLPAQGGEDSLQPMDNSPAYLGVKFDPQIRDAAVARSVTAGSPADQAGLRAGDTIDSINGRRVSSYRDVIQIVNALRPGDILDIDISRRVSVRARAVLNGQPVEGQRTVGYPPDARDDANSGPQLVAPIQEQLPSPANLRYPEHAGTQNRDSTMRQRESAGIPDSSRSDLQRDSESSDPDRGYRFRGRFFRRRN